MRRRHFVLGALGLAGLGGLYAIQPRKRRLPQTGQGTLPSGHRVAVIGGGLAGLSAALELAERGATVTLFEAAPHFGGKLGGWPVRVLGEDFAMEHGFHGFFSQYYNLTDVLVRIGATRLRQASAYPIGFANGGEERFPPEKRAFPLNLLALYASSDHLHWRRMLQAGPPMQAMLEYDPIKTYAALDDVSFADYAKTLDPELVEAMLLPFAKTTLNDPARTSAAHVLRFMHFYFLGNPEGLSYRYTLDDCMRAIIDPWTERLRAYGVTLRPSTRVYSLDFTGDRVAGLRVGSAVSRTVAKLPVVGNEPVAFGDHLFAVQSKDGPLVMRGLCTHQGCPIKAHANGFDCPCHGGRFDLTGIPIDGPPQRPLERLRVAGGDVIEDAASSESLPFDDFVIACDVRGVNQLMQLTLPEADPYLVVRLWLDQRTRPDRTEFYTTTGYDLLDSIAIYDMLQDDYRRYAERTGRSVVELHSYGIVNDQGLAANTTRIIADLRRALPELKDARILEQITMQQANFSGFPMGSHASRPTTTSAFRNLFFAGDWVRTDLPIALMEAAVTTGRLAANAILRRVGAREAPIDIVAPRGVIG